MSWFLWVSIWARLSWAICFVVSPGLSSRSCGISEAHSRGCQQNSVLQGPRPLLLTDYGPKPAIHTAVHSVEVTSFWVRSDRAWEGQQDRHLTSKTISYHSDHITRKTLDQVHALEDSGTPGSWDHGSPWGRLPQATAWCSGRGLGSTWTFGCCQRPHRDVTSGSEWWEGWAETV